MLGVCVLSSSYLISLLSLHYHFSLFLGVNFCYVYDFWLQLPSILSVLFYYFRLFNLLLFLIGFFSLLVLLNVISLIRWFSYVNLFLVFLFPSELFSPVFSLVLFLSFSEVHLF